MSFLQTDRLFLRNLEVSDLDAIYDHRSCESCRRFQRWDELTRDEICEMINRHLDDCFLSEKATQRYAVCSLSSGSLVGELSYFFSKDDCVTLGITISPTHQRQGYAFELLHAVFSKIRKAYPSLDIVGLIDRDNTASIRLFEKLGFSLECYAESIDSLVYVLGVSDN